MTIHSRFFSTTRTIILAGLVLTLAAACSRKIMSGPSASETPGLAAKPDVAAVAAKGPAVPSQSDADRAVTKFNGTTLAQLGEGLTLYKANCGRCHELFIPTQFSEAKWRHKLPPMSAKARISDDAQAKILAYVVTMSGAK